MESADACVCARVVACVWSCVLAGFAHECGRCAINARPHKFACFFGSLYASRVGHAQILFARLREGNHVEKYVMAGLCGRCICQRLGNRDACRPIPDYVQSRASKSLRSPLSLNQASKILNVKIWGLTPSIGCTGHVQFEITKNLRQRFREGVEVVSAYSSDSRPSTVVRMLKSHVAAGLQKLITKLTFENCENFVFGRLVMTGMI